MFEVGGDYTITWLEGGVDSYSTFTVVSWEAPLLKVRQGDQETIFNASSSAFVSAKPRKAESDYTLENL